MTSPTRRIDDPSEERGETHVPSVLPGVLDTSEIEGVIGAAGARIRLLPALPAVDEEVSSLIEYPAPGEVLEAIQNGAAWMGIGIDRRHRENVTRSRDLELWIRYLNDLWAAGTKAFILIADTGAVYNIYAELWRREQNWKEPETKKTDRQLMVEAQKLARQFASRDKAYLEALQNVEKSNQPGVDPNPIYLMSEVLEGNEEFSILFENIQKLIDGNAAVRQKMWECVPEKIRESAGRGASEKPFDEIVGTPQTQSDVKARNLLNYPAFEVAMIIFTRGGTKLGNKPPSTTRGSDFKWGEENYDSLAQLILTNHATELGLDHRGKQLKFSQFTVGGTRSSVPYHFRTVGLDVLGQAFDVRSFIQGVRAWNDADEAGRDLERTRQIYYNFFRRLEASPHLNQEEIASIKRTEVIKLFTEIMIQFTSVPGVKYLILKTKVYEILEDLINGKNPGEKIEALSRGETGIPFSCSRTDQHSQQKRGENDEAYLMWYLYTMISERNGPAIRLSRNGREKKLYKQFGRIIQWLYKELEGKRPPYPGFGYDSRKRKRQGREPFWTKKYDTWCQQEFKNHPRNIGWLKMNEELMPSQRA